MFLTHALRAIFRAAVVTGDSLWKFVTLLISGTPPAVTFISDASTSGNVLTLNGDTRPSNFNPYTPGYYSNYFDGTGDYLTFPSNAAFVFGTGDFTIEFWVNQQNWNPSGGAFYSHWISINSYLSGIMVRPNTTGTGIQVYVGGTDYLFSTTLSLNTWFHVAVSRSSSSMRVFVNGTQIGATQTVSYNISTNTSNAIGTAVHDTSEEMQGYLSNVRVLKGTGLYAANFTPSTIPLTAISGTSLLTCQSNRLIDTSLNNFVITKNGDTTVSGFTPFTPPTSVTVNNLYSTYFDGTGDYIQTVDNTALQMGTGSFTIEFWVNFTTVASYQTIFSKGYNTVGSLVIQTDTGTGRPVLYSNGVSLLACTGSAAPTNTWIHYAIVRNGTTLTWYTNGVATGTTTNSTNHNGTEGAVIGTWAGLTYYLNGYLSNFRIVKGTAVYTANFTPATANLTAISGTSLLTCQDATLKDNSTNAFAITSGGDARPVAQSPFTQTTTAVNTTYLGSGYFDGTGDYLTGPTSNAGLLMGTGDFTIEYWAYKTTSAVVATVVSFGGSSGNLRHFLDNVTPTIWDGASQLGGGNTINLNCWNHIVVQRSGTTLRFYTNGISSATITNSSNFNAGTLGIGGGDANVITGYIADLRIVKGRALYTANFAPPATPLTAVANTSLLTLQTDQPVANKQFVDNSGNNFPITQAGNATQGTFSPYGSNWSNYFDGTGDYLQTATAIFGLGTVFTVEAWIYPTSLTNGAIVFSSTASAEFSLGYNVNTRFGISSRGISWLLDSTTLPTLNTWNHVVVARGGLGTNQTSLYLNGTRVANGTVNNAFTTLSTWQVGYDAGGGGSAWPGYISNLRVVAGTDVYGYTNSTITSPTSPLTAIANTKLLTCQDNRFVDDSPNNFTLTRNGDVSVQRFSPFSPVIQTPTTYSTFFDGTGDSLTVASNAAFAYGTGAFTVEFWVYSIGTAAAQVWVINSGLTLNIQRNGSGFYNVYDGTDRVSTTSVVSNVWNHVAVVRTGTGTNQTNLYVNGVSVLNWTSAVNYGSDNFALSGSATFPCTCYISNVRVVKGTAVYTANFTPPTSPLTAISGTSLLTCQSATHRDNSANALTITQAGDAIPRQFNPFGFTNTTTGTAYTPALYGGSAYFDGTGDYLTTPSNAAITQFGTGDFTVECWAYTTSNPHAVGMYLFDVRTSGSTGNWALFFASGNGLTFFYNGASIATTAATFSTSTWYHIAYSRKSTSGKLFVNGVSVASVTDSNNYSLTTVGTIGSRYTIEALLQGYISDARIVKGTALYTGNFVPPLAPLTATTGTTLLLNMDKGAAVDSSRSNDLETVGDAKLRDETPYAGSYYSNFFDGTGDYLNTSSATFSSTSDLTLECWAYVTSASNYAGIVSLRNSTNSAGMGLNINNTGYLEYVLNNSGGTSLYTGTLCPLNQWFHIALVRSGTGTNNCSCYLNGNRVAQFTGNNEANGAANALIIGRYYADGASQYFLNGYVSNLRYVKGTAVYSGATYTVPTAPLTAISGTSLLTCQSKSFVDNSSNNFTITRTGDVAVKSQNPFQKNTYSSMYFDGTGDGLLFPASAVFPSGAGSAFTFEFWIYPNAQALTILRPNGNMSGFVVGTTASGQVEIQNNFAASILITSSNALALGTWNHVAITRTTANLYTIYINGLSSGSVTYATALGAAQMYIGYNTYSGASMNAYLADVRTTTGAARYTANFTPPTAPLPTS